jgi:transcriptional regulator
LVGGDAPAAFIDGQLKGIIGVRIPVSRLEGKRKLSQNRSAADRDGVADGLMATDRPGDQVVSRLMPRHRP